MPERRTLHRPASLLVVAGLIAACSTSAGSSPAAGITSSPAATILPSPTAAASGARITPVYSTGGGPCTITHLKDEDVGGNEVMVEHFTCPYAMSDGRLDGTMEADFTTTFAPASAPTARWEGTVTISNAGGTWTGPARGAVVMWPDEFGNPTNYGAGTYVGTGRYAGLVYHELIAGGDAYATLSGWIEPAD